MAEEQEYKKRRILERDFDTVEKFVNEELETRAKNPFRKICEARWKTVDRQIAMEPMRKVSPDGRPIKGVSWESALELGELSKASEIITADVMRINFANANWLEPHVQLEGQMDPRTGKYVIPEGEQEKADGLMRALLVQQHKDFNFKGRVKLSVKEALHHGSFVVEARWGQEMFIQGGKVKTVGAPIWQLYSMWNAYPDSSPSVGMSLFYSGSMILVEYMPLYKLKRMKGEGWLPNRIKLVKKEEHKDKDNETQDVKLVKFYGDVCIERQDGDIYLPNMKVIVANGKLVYAAANELPYLPIIYAGYERQDVRDPYYTSPIIKQSPTQTLTTVMANEFIDAIKLKVKPPVEYDGNDPDYVANGGPDLSPASKNPTKSMGKGFKALDIGDPSAALNGLQFGVRQLQEGLGVSSLRQGSATSDRQTATEAKIMEAGSEVRTVDFAADLETQALRPWLYMQHDLNRLYLKEYLAYSNELNTPDVVRFTKSDVDKDVHFDVVGAKGILGEQQRREQTSNVTVFASGNPLFAPLLKPDRILIGMYRDAGMKNPEEWVRTQQDGPQIPPQVQAMIQELQRRLQEAESGLQAKLAEIQADKARTAEELKLAREKAAAEHKLAVDESRREFALKVAEMRAELAIENAKAKSEAQNSKAAVQIDMGKATAEAMGALEQRSLGHSKDIAKAAETLVGAASKMVEAAEKMAAPKPKRKAKVRRTPDGYEMEDA